MIILKRSLVLFLFLALFVFLIVSLSVLAGQMPNPINVIPKLYQSKIQLTFQAGYEQMLRKAANFLGTADGTQANTLSEPTPIQANVILETQILPIETATFESAGDIFSDIDSAYPVPLPDQDSPYYLTIIKSLLRDDEFTLSIQQREFIERINETERGSAIDSALGSVLDPKTLDGIKAAQTDVFPANIDANFFIHLPAIYMLYPRPEGYDEAIARKIQAVDIERYEASIRNLVENYSPRHHGSNQVIINFQNCVQSLTQFEKHNLLRALEDTQERFEALGLTVTQEPVADSAGSYNLVATKPAVRQNESAEIIELGAHLDAKWEAGGEITPGASDNAAGVAGLLEIAATLKDYPNRHPWRFVVFVGEENGKTGSLTHVQTLQNQPFKVALIMDGIGWSESSPEFMNCIYSKDSIPYTGEVAQLFDQVRQIYGIPTGWRQCTYPSDFSDQGSYWKSGYAAVLSVGGLPYNDPNLHECSDNMSTLNLDNAYYAIQENLGVLLTLDQE